MSWTQATKGEQHDDFKIFDWRGTVAIGDTDKGYVDWVNEKLQAVRDAVAAEPLTDTERALAAIIRGIGKNLRGVPTGPTRNTLHRHVEAHKLFIRYGEVAGEPEFVRAENPPGPSQLDTLLNR